MLKVQRDETTPRLLPPPNCPSCLRPRYQLLELPAGRAAASGVALPPASHQEAPWNRGFKTETLKLGNPDVRVLGGGISSSGKRSKATGSFLFALVEELKRRLQQPS